LAEAFGKDPEDMHFLDAFDMADAAQALAFEGAPTGREWTEQEWQLVQNLSFTELNTAYSEEMLRAQFTRDINPILGWFRGKIDSKKYGNGFGGADFVLFSQHDTQINQHNRYLKPENYVIDHIPYASFFLYELHKDESK